MVVFSTYNPFPNVMKRCSISLRHENSIGTYLTLSSLGNATRKFVPGESRSQDNLGVCAGSDPYTNENMVINRPRSRYGPAEGEQLVDMCSWMLTVSEN